MASKAELDLLKKDANQRVAAATRRFKTQNMQSMFIRKGSLVSISALYGTFNRLGVPITIGGFPWKIGVVTVATLTEGLSKGVLQAIAAGVADGTTAIYIERAISTGSVIAGHGERTDDDDDDDDDDEGGEI